MGLFVKFITREVAIMILPETEPIFSERGTRIEIVDESAGEYVEVSQEGRTDLGKIAIEPEEWPELRAAIDRMIANCAIP